MLSFLIISSRFIRPKSFPGEITSELHRGCVWAQPGTPTPRKLCDLGNWHQRQLSWGRSGSFISLFKGLKKNKDLCLSTPSFWHSYHWNFEQLKLCQEWFKTPDTFLRVNEFFDQTSHPLRVLEFLDSFQSGTGGVFAIILCKNFLFKRCQQIVGIKCPEVYRKYCYLGDQKSTGSLWAAVCCTVHLFTFIVGCCLLYGALVHIYFVKRN